MTAIILGMHRSGTSLVASMLQAMGIHMGDELLGPSLANPGGHFEDVDFYHANRAMIDAAGGAWDVPPKRETLDAVGRQFEQDRQALVDRKNRAHAFWGWKDPRTTLTAHLWHPHLTAPRYIVVRRDRADVIASLENRDGPGDWGALVDQYQAALDAFVANVGAPVFRVRYEDLTHPKAAPRRVQNLAQFLGLGSDAVERALDCIEWRDSWGFGSVAFGVPYFRPRAGFWLSWSLFWAAQGYEPGDWMLNNDKTPMGERLPLAHNWLMRSFLANATQDTLCIMEDDHIWHPDQLRRMRFKPENQRFDIVCASYINRRSGGSAVPLPVGWDIPPEYADNYGAVFHLDDIATTGTQAYDGAAFGFALIRRWVLEEMLGDEDDEHFQWAELIGEGSPDVPFFYKTAQMGAKSGVDRDNHIGHVGEKVYNVNEYHEWFDRNKHALKAQSEGNDG